MPISRPGKGRFQLIRGRLNADFVGWAKGALFAPRAHRLRLRWARFASPTVRRFHLTGIRSKKSSWPDHDPPCRYPSYSSHALWRRGRWRKEARPSRVCRRNRLTRARGNCGSWADILTIPLSSPKRPRPRNCRHGAFRTYRHRPKPITRLTTITSLLRRRILTGLTRRGAAQER